ncbi:MAG: acylphosphatase [Bacteroidetes bacterium]|nr:MAG: acylphosphatase [Bacteroidota bacterium]
MSNNIEKKHVKIIVSGKVQGVGFRYQTYQEAIKLGIFGYVKNQLDRTVLIEVEGDAYKVDIFIEWCKHGTSFSRVDNIKIVDLPIENLDKFVIR